MTSEISINRAPVLTLWAAVVAQRLGFNWDEAVSLGKAVAGLSAQAKGGGLGILSRRRRRPRPPDKRNGVNNSGSKSVADLFRQ